MRKRAERLLSALWYQKPPWRFVAYFALAPLSLLYFIGQKLDKHLSLREADQSLRLLSTSKLMVVGNEVVGGAGKTPTVIALVKALNEQAINVAVISRGYGSAASAARLVDSADAKRFGDEAVLFFEVFSAAALAVPVVCAAKRNDAIALVLKHAPDTQLIISDDGLGHYAMHRDLELVLYKAARGEGNGLLLPLGPRREILRADNKLKRLKLITDASDASTAQANIASDYACSLEVVGFTSLAGKPLEAHELDGVMATGLADPEGFARTLKASAVTIRQHCIFADHHDYSPADIARLLALDARIFITQKDAVKIQPLLEGEDRERFIVCEIAYQLPNALLAQITSILKLND